MSEVGLDTSEAEGSAATAGTLRHLVEETSITAEFSENSNLNKREKKTESTYEKHFSQYIQFPQEFSDSNFK